MTSPVGRASGYGESELCIEVVIMPSAQGYQEAQERKLISLLFFLSFSVGLKYVKMNALLALTVDFGRQ